MNPPAQRLSRKQLNAILSEKIDADAILQTINAGLNATRQIVHNGQLTDVPDHATRLKFAEFWRDTVEGTPIKRQEILTATLTPNTPPETRLRECLTRSPEFRRQLETLLKETA